MIAPVASIEPADGTVAGDGSASAPEDRGFDGRNLLTIDVEEYFHATGLGVPPERWERLPGRVEYSTRRLLHLLAEADTRATFFVLGWVAERYPELVREIHRAGHEIASHGYAHRLIYEQDARAFEEDVVRAKSLLEQLVGAPVHGYRAPSFSIGPATRWALDVLASAGYRYDSSIYPVRRARYGDPGAPRRIHRLTTPSGASLLEVPPSTVRIAGRNLAVAGGGYFRFYPAAVTRQAIRHLNETEGMPAMIYLHPWEIDPHQPRLPAGRADRWRHYLNLGRTESRLRGLLREHDLVPVAELLGDALSRPHELERVAREGVA